MRKTKRRINFNYRTPGYFKKPFSFLHRYSATPFGQIQMNRYGSSAGLLNQSKFLLIREQFRYLIAV
jgi:hypothetical protein